MSYSFAWVSSPASPSRVHSANQSPTDTPYIYGDDAKKGVQRPAVRSEHYHPLHAKQPPMYPRRGGMKHGLAIVITPPTSASDFNSSGSLSSFASDDDSDIPPHHPRAAERLNARGSRHLPHHHTPDDGHKPGSRDPAAALRCHAEALSLLRWKRSQALLFGGDDDADNDGHDHRGPHRHGNGGVDVERESAASERRSLAWDIATTLSLAGNALRELDDLGGSARAYAESLDAFLDGAGRRPTRGRPPCLRRSRTEGSFGPLRGWTRAEDREHDIGEEEHDEDEDPTRPMDNGADDGGRSLGIVGRTLSSPGWSPGRSTSPSPDFAEEWIRMGRDNDSNNGGGEEEKGNDDSARSPRPVTPEAAANNDIFSRNAATAGAVDLASHRPFQSAVRGADRLLLDLSLVSFVGRGDNAGSCRRRRKKVHKAAAVRNLERAASSLAVAGPLGGEEDGGDGDDAPDWEVLRDNDDDRDGRRDCFHRRSNSSLETFTPTRPGHRRDDDFAALITPTRLPSFASRPGAAGGGRRRASHRDATSFFDGGSTNAGGGDGAERRRSSFAARAATGGGGASHRDATSFFDGGSTNAAGGNGAEPHRSNDDDDDDCTKRGMCAPPNLLARNRRPSMNAKPSQQHRRSARPPIVSRALSLPIKSHHQLPVESHHHHCCHLPTDNSQRALRLLSELAPLERKLRDALQNIPEAVQILKHGGGGGGTTAATSATTGLRRGMTK